MLAGIGRHLSVSMSIMGSVFGLVPVLGMHDQACRIRV